VPTQLEARFFPVITDQSIINIRRDGERVCRTWRWTKRRYAYPKTVFWNWWSTARPSLRRSS
jgi:hypothetical protein